MKGDMMNGPWDTSAGYKCDLEGNQGIVVRRFDITFVFDHFALCEEVGVLHGLLIAAIEGGLNHNHRKLFDLDRGEKGLHDSSADGEVFRMDMSWTHKVRTEAWILFGDLQQPIFSETLFRVNMCHTSSY